MISHDLKTNEPTCSTKQTNHMKYMSKNQQSLSLNTCIGDDLNQGTQIEVVFWYIL